MKKPAIVLISFLSISGCVFAEQEFIRLPGVEMNVYTVAVSSDSRMILAGSKNAVWKSTDGGSHFSRVLTIQGEGGQVNFILFDRAQKEKLYIATEAGLYYSQDAGVHFEKILKGKDSDETDLNIFHLAQAGTLYAATNNGLYRAANFGGRLRKIAAFSRNTSVYWIEFLEDSPRSFFAATSKGLYRTDDGAKSFRRLLIKSDFEQTEDPYSEEIDQARNVPRVVKVVYDPFEVYLGTTEGLFVSYNGENFAKKYFSVLEGARITSIFQYGNALYVAADKGFFSLDRKNGQLVQIEKGLDTRDIRFADFSDQAIFLATSRGLFGSRIGPQLHTRENGEDFRRTQNNSRNEYCCTKIPDIRIVQEAACAYNEVNPEKIKQWRRNLKYRALVPSLNLSYDKTITYDSGVDRYVTGPRDWGASLSWDIADLIWNSYEDDIDTRSRLNTQLRFDVLDEINRLYFERKKLCLELQSIAYGEWPDEKKIRLEELTAALDGYTGGFFSRHLRK